MSDSKIVQIIHTNLKKYTKIEDINFFPSNGIIKYTFNIMGYYFEIVYDFTDAFYRIKLEKIMNNEIKDIIFLTKSKRFQKGIYIMLKNLNQSKKSFENHITAFTIYLNKILEKYENLNFIVETYISDLKYDGIFI